MYSMKDVCEKTGLAYETLRFYCNEGLVPNVSRDKNNYRVFSERDVAWIEGLLCLKKCEMSIRDMKQYMNLCLTGKSSIPERKDMLETQRRILLERMEKIRESLDYIDHKQEYYDRVMDGSEPYRSNLINTDETESA